MAIIRHISWLIVSPGLIAQNAQLSEAAQQLLLHPRHGQVELTRADGRKQRGAILRVTNESVVFSPNYSHPPACEDVALSQIAALDWPVYPRTNPLVNFGGVTLLGAVFGPVFAAHGVANTFRMIAPPLNPIDGEWQSHKPSPSGFKSSLVFKGPNVEYEEIVVRRGRYFVDGDQLHLVFDKGPEEITSFHFECGQLILSDHEGSFFASSSHPPSEPIVGDWRTHSMFLDFRPDGTFEETKNFSRVGTYEQAGKTVHIHWHSGEEWTAEIKRQHLILRVGVTATTYRYVPPDLDLGSDL